MQGDHAPAAHAYDAPRRSPGLRELEAAESFAGFGDAVRFALDIISWRLPGSDPFVTRVHGDEVSLHMGPGDDRGPAAAGPGAKGYVGMPLIGSGGRQLGSLCILDRDFEGADDHAVQRMLEAMGRILISEIEREEREESLREAAEIDPLTGLLNRRSFEFALRHEWRRARSGESDSRLVVADVNGLKPVNDELGHPIGDKLLRDVTDSIRAAARDSDVVGRLGGDEFGVVLVGAGEDGEARFRDRLAAELAGRSSAGVSPSVAVGGTALSRASSAEEAITLADRRMYRDKRRRFRATTSA